MKIFQRPCPLPSFLWSAAGVGAALVLSAAACGDDGETATTGGDTTSSGSGGTGGVDDGKFHPPTNGVVATEADACADVANAFQARLSALGCVATAPSCPGLIRASSGADTCSSYDEGTSTGCAEYVTAAADCDDLQFRLGDCIVEPIDGSAPNGCPS